MPSPILPRDAPVYGPNRGSVVAPDAAAQLPAARDRGRDDGAEPSFQARMRRGQSCATDARAAAREFHAAVAQPDMALVVFFCSGQYDLGALASELNRLFAGVQVVGCTTAGEFGPAGYRDRSISGASFPAASFAASSGRLRALQRFEIGQAQFLARELVRTLDRIEPAAAPANTFALMLIDGLSVREEAVTRALRASLGNIQWVGGSAGDGLRFGKSYVYFDDRFHDDSAVVVLVTTPVPFTTFKTQHFVPTSERVVITAADAEHRIVIEIDGWPAAKAYAELVGASVTSLDPRSFSAQPMVVVIDGTNYVRSIQKANSDGSLTFFCAIEEGMVLRLAQGVNLVEDLEHAFAEIQTAIGQPQAIIGCDCVLRKLEIAERGLVERVEAVFRANNVVGFNGYGEQYGGVHINQTLTGIAIGDRSDG